MAQKKQKRKGKSETILDAIDYEILRMLSIHKRLTITALRDVIGLTHANLTTHLKRLINLLDRDRDQQTIYVSTNRGGKTMLKMIDEYFPHLKTQRRQRELERSPK